MSKYYLIDGVEVSEDVLLGRIRSGESHLFSDLCSAYIPLISRYIALFNCPETEKDDFMQIGLLAVYSAVDAFDFSSASFSTFVSLCIKRALISELRHLTCKKQIPASALIDAQEVELVDINDPESLFINKESVSLLVMKIKDELSEFEYSVLKEYLKFGSYGKAAKKLCVTEKEISNALQRARKKIRKSIGSYR